MKLILFNFEYDQALYEYLKFNRNTYEHYMHVYGSRRCISSDQDIRCLDLFLTMKACRRCRNK